MLNTFIRGTATGSGGGVAQHASFQIPFSCCCYCCSHFIFCKRTAAFASLKVAGERGVARCQVRTDGLSTLLISVYLYQESGGEEAWAVEFSVCSIFFRYQACWVVSLYQLFCASSLSLDLVNICQSLACLPYCKTSEQRTCLGVVDVAVDVVVVVDTTH